MIMARVSAVIQYIYPGHCKIAAISVENAHLNSYPLLIQRLQPYHLNFVLIKWTTVKHTLLPFVLSIGHGQGKTV